MFVNKYIVIHTLNYLIIGASFKLNTLYKGRRINGVKYKNANTLMCNCDILRISMLKNKPNRPSRFYVVDRQTCLHTYIQYGCIVCFIHVLAQSEHTKYTTKTVMICLHFFAFTTDRFSPNGLSPVVKTIMFRYFALILLNDFQIINMVPTGYFYL